jgi:hypothetical protein
VAQIDTPARVDKPRSSSELRNDPAFMARLRESCERSGVPVDAPPVLVDAISAMF